MADKPSLVDDNQSTVRNLSYLQAGTAITIDIRTPAGQKKKFATHYIGFLPNKYVLVELPDSTRLGNFSQYITQGTVVTVRGLIEGREGAAVAFLSTIKQTLQIPSRIMVLDTPNKVMVQHLRASIRIDTQITVQVKIDDNFWKATLVNLSVDGGQLDIENGEELVLAEDKVIDISVEAGPGEKSIKLNASICNIKQQVNGLSFGVKFNEVGKEQVVALLHRALS